jgi:hypothetical protein
MGDQTYMINIDKSPRMTGIIARLQQLGGYLTQVISGAVYPDLGQHS